MFKVIFVNIQKHKILLDVALKMMEEVKMEGKLDMCQYIPKKKFN